MWTCIGVVVLCFTVDNMLLNYYQTKINLAKIEKGVGEYEKPIYIPADDQSNCQQSSYHLRDF